MTIKKLKELIQYMPDDARIYLDDGTSFFEGNSEVICLTRGDYGYKNKVILQTKNDIDVGEELDARLDFYRESDWEEYDAFLDLGEFGYTLDDFRYDDDVYGWAKNYSKDHSW